ncbi:MAG: hypothetical protein U0002_13440 [Thermoanaerobaculia bacterium]
MPSQPFHLASRRPFVVALALLATSCGAGFSDLPSLSPWSDAEISLSIPTGWQASRAGSSVMVLADPRNPNAGMLQLLVEGGGSGAAEKVAALAAKAAGSGHGARLVERQTLQEGRGALAVVELSEPGVKMAFFGLDDPQNGLSSLTTFAAPAEAFERAGGTRLLLMVGSSVRAAAGSQLAAAAAQSGGRAAAGQGEGGFAQGYADPAGGTRVRREGFASPEELAGAGGIDPGALAGTWRSTDLDSSLDLEAAAGFSFVGSGSNFDFDGDGGYTLDYNTRFSYGVQQSGAEVHEEGRYWLEDGTLTLAPGWYRGWIANFSLDNREPLADSSPPRRSYRALAQGGRLVLVGVCAPFQVDLSCKNGREVALALERN